MGRPPKHLIFIVQQQEELSIVIIDRVKLLLEKQGEKCTSCHLETVLSIEQTKFAQGLGKGERNFSSKVFILVDDPIGSNVISTL